MFKLLDIIKGREAESRRAAVAYYRAILEKGDQATPEEMEALAVLMTQLNKSSVDAEVDLRAIAERHRLQGLIESTPAAEAEAIKAREAHAAHLAESEKIIAQLKRKGADLLQCVSETNRRHIRALNSVVPLAELEKANWELFGLEPPQAGPGPRGPQGPRAA